MITTPKLKPYHYYQLLPKDRRVITHDRNSATIITHYLLPMITYYYYHYLLPMIIITHVIHD